jgi:hypothetical protein
MPAALFCTLKESLWCKQERLDHTLAIAASLMSVIDAIRSPARERREVYVRTFSLRSRSGLQPEIVILYVSEFVATYTSGAFFSCLPQELQKWRINPMANCGRCAYSGYYRPY